MGLSYAALIMLRQGPSLSTSWRVFFIINGCWILSKAFYEFLEMIIWFLFFHLLMHCITDWLEDSEKSFHSWDKPRLIMVYDSFNVLWILFTSNFFSLKNFRNKFLALAIHWAFIWCLSSWTIFSIDIFLLSLKCILLYFYESLKI